MPRRRVDRVTEERVTLGDKERQLLAEAMAQRATDRDVALAVDLIKTAMLPLGLVGFGYLAYLGLTNFATGLDPLKDAAKQAADTAAAATGVDAFLAGLALEDPDSLTPEQIMALANANLNPLTRGLAGYGVYGGLLRRLFA